MSTTFPKGPQRIVCLTEEPTEILYALGAGDRVVGISAYTERPPRAKEKPVVSAFIGGSIEKIKSLKPDLIVGFSDIQADLARDLIKENLQVLIFNQRTLDEILEVILGLGRLVGKDAEAQSLVGQYLKHLECIAEQGRSLPVRPRVYFEEWDDPMISCIRWVSELIEIAGGYDIFAEASHGKAARDRFVDWGTVVSRAPDLMLASWCGKPVDQSRVASRPGFKLLPIAKPDRLIEIPSTIILQPGPACLTDGLDVLHAHIARVARELDRR